MGEFVAYQPTANAGVGFVDHALFAGVIYPDDNRLEPWLRTAERTTDTYVLDAAGRIRASMAEWQTDPTSEPRPNTARGHQGIAEIN